MLEIKNFISKHAGRKMRIVLVLFLVFFVSGFPEIDVGHRYECERYSEKEEKEKVSFIKHRNGLPELP